MVIIIYMSTAEFADTIEDNVVEGADNSGNEGKVFNINGVQVVWPKAVTGNTPANADAWMNMFIGDGINVLNIGAHMRAQTRLLDGPALPFNTISANVVAEWTKFAQSNGVDGLTEELSKPEKKARICEFAPELNAPGEYEAFLKRTNHYFNFRLGLEN